MQHPLRQMGYVGVHAARDQREAQLRGQAQSDCIIWNDRKFAMIRRRIVRFPDVLDHKSKSFDPRYEQWFGDIKPMSLRSNVKCRPDLVIILLMECKATNRQFIVCSSHFYWCVLSIYIFPHDLSVHNVREMKESSRV